MEREFCSVTEAAHRIGISKSYMYRLVAAGTIPTVQLGRRKLIPADALDEFITQLSDKAGA